LLKAGVMLASVSSQPKAWYHFIYTP
jgi:hypothetical protein